MYPLADSPLLSQSLRRFGQSAPEAFKIYLKNEKIFLLRTQ